MGRQGACWWSGGRARTPAARPRAPGSGSRRPRAPGRRPPLAPPARLGSPARGGPAGASGRGRPGRRAPPRPQGRAPPSPAGGAGPGGAGVVSGRRLAGPAARTAGWSRGTTSTTASSVRFGGGWRGCLRGVGREGPHEEDRDREPETLPTGHQRGARRSVRTTRGGGRQGSVQLDAERRCRLGPGLRGGPRGGCAVRSGRVAAPPLGAAGRAALSRDCARAPRRPAEWAAPRRGVSQPGAPPVGGGLGRRCRRAVLVGGHLAAIAAISSLSLQQACGSSSAGRRGEGTQVAARDGAEDRRPTPRGTARLGGRFTEADHPEPAGDRADRGAAGRNPHGRQRRPREEIRETPAPGPAVPWPRAAPTEPVGSGAAPQLATATWDGATLSSPIPPAVRWI